MSAATPRRGRRRILRVSAEQVRALGSPLSPVLSFGTRGHGHWARPAAAAVSALLFHGLLALAARLSPWLAAAAALALAVGLYLTFFVAPDDIPRTFGRFDDAAREYVITRPDTPWPWINYLGTGDFFSLVSNAGGGYSFYRDARLRRLTQALPTAIEYPSLLTRFSKKRLADFPLRRGVVSLAGLNAASSPHWA